MRTGHGRAMSGTRGLAGTVAAAEPRIRRKLSSSARAAAIPMPAPVPIEKTHRIESIPPAYEKTRQLCGGDAAKARTLPLVTTDEAAIFSRGPT
jgi:hypothetical protein